MVLVVPEYESRSVRIPVVVQGAGVPAPLGGIPEHIPNAQVATAVEIDCSPEERYFTSPLLGDEVLIGEQIV